MSASPFRSHLMQSWTRNQTRPPIALVPWLTSQHLNCREHEEGDGTPESEPRGSSRLNISISSVESAESPSPWSVSSTAKSATTRRFLSNSASSSPNFSEPQENKDRDKHDDSSISLTRSFQLLLSSRNTAVNLTVSGDASDQRGKISQALTRATECAMMAPNHKRTEPWRFRRMLSPSTACSTLADIAYQVNLHKSPQVAEAKRQKWLKIPAFLVTLVHDNQPIMQHNSDDLYELLPYVPPESERQLEDVSEWQKRYNE